MVEVIKIMVTSFKRSHPNPAAGHCQPMTLLETSGHSQGHLWGHRSFLLGPGVHKVLFVPSNSQFPQSYGSSGSSRVWLMVISFKRA